MASSSSHRWNYDVFLSFRGKDTRRTFTSHLYEGMKYRGLKIYQDDKMISHGKSISQELKKAIEESYVAIIIFSKNYASSTWCLDELVKIMECKAKYGQMVIPIFYDVDASTIRYQKGSFAEAFAKHESRCKVNDVEGMLKIQAWRIALAAAADLRGYDRTESEIIKKIIDRIIYKMNDVQNTETWGMGGAANQLWASSSAATRTRKCKDVHDVLVSVGLPRGLIPDNVKSFTVSVHNKLRVVLKKACLVEFGTGEIFKYGEVIEGMLTRRSFNQVFGITSAQGEVHRFDVAGNEAIIYIGSEQEIVDKYILESIPICLPETGATNCLRAEGF